MSARMRSPRGSGQRATRLHVAVVAALVGAGAAAGALYPAKGVAKARKVPAKTSRAHPKPAAHTKTSHKAVRSAKRSTHPRAHRSAKTHRTAKARRSIATRSRPRVVKTSHARKHRPRTHLARSSDDVDHLVIPQGDGDGSPVLEFAAQLLGRPYRWGADRGAFDCSGFVRRVFAKVGMDLPHSARKQFGLGDRVARDDLEPGDLVFFSNRQRKYATHVGIYVGDDLFIHASYASGRVQVNSLLKAYYAHRYLGARRLEI